MADPKPDVRAIFCEALERESEEERRKYLDEACQNDRHVRQRVEALLRAHSDAGGFLDGQLTDALPASDQVISEKPGARIGPYKLLQRLGEGGMGVVYMAEQSEPVKRRVALKIIKPGMDTRQVIARFEAERQALAMMDHPDIAKVLDAGATDSGRPYFVMELVNGIPLTQYCDEQQMAPKDRLELFIPICQAIQHAHQKGIIHRDIKPSNVLVAMFDDKAVPKVIDFGVAKATSQSLTEKTMFTQLGQIVGTLEYMSPEQANLNQLDIDTRSDIYSLGVLLYELLTGATPFDGKRLRSAAFEEMMRIIREEEPPRPSLRLSTIDTLPSVAANRKIEPKKLSVLVRGELDWIVMKALEKDRGRRYETANGFAADIQRYLNDEPVVACPPSAAYKFRKFARRNKAALATATLVAAALVFGIVGTTWQALRAKQQAIRATHAERDAKAERDIADAKRIEADAARQDAEDAKDAEREQREQVTRLLASSYVDHAQALCEQGEIGRGILWFSRSIRNAPQDAVDLRQLIRTNLAAWHRQLHSLKTLVQLEKTIRSVALSPDGSRMLTVCEDGTLRLWDAATGRSMGKPHQGVLEAMFSADGSRIALRDEDGRVHLGDPVTLERLGGPLEFEGRILRMAFSSDGSRLMTTGSAGVETAVRIWDVTTGAPVGDAKRIQGQLRAIALCADGRARVAVSLDPHTHQLVDVESGEPVGPPVEHLLNAAIAIHPDGSRFATAGHGSVIRVWDANTGQLVFPQMTHGNLIEALVFSPDGSRIACGGSERSARVWDATTGRTIGVPMRHGGTVRHIAFSADGARMLTASEDGTARLWDIVQDGSLGSVIEHEDRLLTAAFSPDGLRILTKKNDQAQLRDGATGQPLGKPFLHKIPIHAMMAFSADGSRFVVVNGRCQLMDVASGGPVGEPLDSMVHDVAFSPDGSRILLGTQHGYAQLFDAATGAPLGQPVYHADCVHTVAFSPDGSRMLTGSLDGDARLWESATLKPIGEPLTPPSGLKSAAYGPDGILTGLSDWTVRLWDLATCKPVGIPLHHQNTVGAVAFSPCGRRLLTFSNDQTVRVWDRATFKPIGPRFKHTARWPALSFSPDGARFLVQDKFGPPRFWDAPPGPMQGDPQRITLWAQVVTGLALDENGGIDVLDGAAWQERNEQLKQLGGPPAPAPLPSPVCRAETDFARSMDLALAGHDRAVEGLWDDAVAAFSDAIALSGNSPTLRCQIGHWCRRLAQTRDGSGRDQELARKASAYATTLLESREIKTEPITASEEGR